MKHTDDKERAAILALNERLARSAYRAARQLSPAERLKQAFQNKRFAQKMGFDVSGAAVDGESVTAAAACAGSEGWQ